MTDTELEDLSAKIPLKKPERTIVIVENGERKDVTPPSMQVDIQFTDMSYSVPQRKGKWKQILNNVNGEFRSGHLTAILGPSGAGKTTLLNLISSRKILKNNNSLRGTLRLNGFTQSENPELFRKLSICYVPQEFALISLLTTRETIHIATRLKLPEKTHNSKAKKYIIQDVAKRLGLLDCMDTPTSSLSGGEKKRLSIAVEMITSPSVMLLDEPTSGLDSASSAQVINLLYSMSRYGCTVVCAVHQPSSQMTFCFDDMLIMSQGRCPYYGPRERILDFFKDAGYDCPPFYNLAEFVLEVVTGQRGGNYEQICSKESSDNQSVDEIKSTSYPDSEDSKTNFNRRYAVSEYEQMKVLLHRAFVCIARDNTMTYLRLCAHLVVAVLIGFVFQNFGEDAKTLQSNIACLFFFVIFLFFANSMPSVQMFPAEATVFLRENKNHWYSLESYYITKILSDIPMQFICPTGFLAIAYYMTGQPLEPIRFFQVWILCILFAILAQAYGTVIGAAFNTHIGMFLVPASNVPMFLFAGFFLKLSEIPYFLRFFSTISYFRYVFEGIIQAVYIDRPKLPCSEDFCYLRKWKQILEILNMPSVSYNTAVIAVIIWIGVLHVLTYSVLRYKLYLAKH